jgi:hypothetical protein
MSEYPTGRTALGDLIASELARNPNSPRNRAQRAADDEEGLRLAKELAASMEQDRKQADAARALSTDEISKMLGAERTDITPDAKPPAVTLLTGSKSA